MTRYRQASFRGVEFEYEEDEFRLMPKQAEQDFLGSDFDTSEDMGFEPKQFFVKGFIWGKDYEQKRNNLVAALEKGGLGTLIHPHYGTIKVRISDEGCIIRHSRQKGGFTEFELNFKKEDEAALKLSVLPVRAEKSRILQVVSDNASKVSKQVFVNNFSVEKMPDFVVDDAEQSIADIVNEITNNQKYNASSTDIVTTLIADKTSLLSETRQNFNDTSALANQMTSLLNFSGLANSFDAVIEACLFDVDVSMPRYLTSARKQQIANQQALIALVRREALISAAKIASTQEYQTKEAAKETIGKLGELFEKEIYNIEDQELQSVLQELLGTSAAIIADKDAGKTVVKYSNQGIVPAAVIAHEVYGDKNSFEATNNLVSANFIKHPSFVPSDITLEVPNV